MSSGTQRRKLGHLNTCLRRDVESTARTGFDEVILIHRALPEIDRDEIELSTDFLGHRLDAPIILESMTGGTADAEKINSILADAAEKFGVGIGVGSQRAAIENSRLAYTYSIVRKRAPGAFVFANLGYPQLRGEDFLDRVRIAVDMVEANAIMIHLNPLQESVQVEGEPEFSGALARIQELTNAVDLPVVVKETGAGISAEVARDLERAGADGVDIAGAGGTSWAAVEYHRARRKGSKLHEYLGRSFWNWGIPTVASIVEAAKSTNLIIFASGGVRNGLHIAKSLALGSHFAGMALPLLRAARISPKALEDKLTSSIEELKTAMFLVGARNINMLRKAPLVVTGNMFEWLVQRGFNPSQYASRS